MKSNGIMILAAVLCLCAGVEARTWTNTEGKTLEAELVRVSGDTVYLEIGKGGKIRPLKISMLCEADQDFIMQYEKGLVEQQKAEALAKRKAKWLDKYDDVQTESKQFDLPILLLYTAPEWCGYCMKLEDNVLSQKTFKEYANTHLVLFLADFSQSNDAEKWKEKYPQLIKDFPCSGYPCAYLMTSDGKQLGKISGYDSDWSVQDYIGMLEGYKAKGN